MTNYMRELRVAELNRILPMISDTTLKRHHIELLDAKISFQRQELDEITERIGSLRKTLDTSFKDAPKGDCQTLETLLSSYQEKSKSLLESIDDLASERDPLVQEYDLEVSLYQKICDAIRVNKRGFLREEEIQAKFLSSYLYLFYFCNQGRFLNRLHVFDIFEVGNGLNALLDLICSTYTPEYVKEIFNLIGYKE